VGRLVEGLGCGGRVARRGVVDGDVECDRLQRESEKVSTSIEGRVRAYTCILSRHSEQISAPRSCLVVCYNSGVQIIQSRSESCMDLCIL
jgi:hypothetical protein